MQCQLQPLALRKPVFDRAPMFVERHLLPGAVERLAWDKRWCADHAIEVFIDQPALRNPYWNPRPVERAPLRALLEAAFIGQRSA